jgi:hypothetical protein
MGFFDWLKPKHSAPAPPPPAAPAPARPTPSLVAADGTITVDGRYYCPFTALVGPAGAAAPGQAAWTFAGKVADRSQFRPPEAKVDLKAAYGAYMSLGGRNVLIVIDQKAVEPGSDYWNFIHAAAKTLVEAYPALDAQAKAALANLNAVIFTQKPERSFASVAGGWFFYDTDELHRSDNQLITPPYAASNIVHDANHIRQYHLGQQYWGDAAEIDGWQLQVNNRAALGLVAGEVTHLQGFIDHPETARQRMNQRP